MEVNFDFDACLKSFRDAFHQFNAHPTEEHTKNLEREIYVLVGITKRGKGKILDNFDLQNLLHADSLSIFINILNDVSLRASIYASSISLLSELASSAKIRKSLQDTFKLTSTLLTVITQHQNGNDQAILIKCLHLLQQVTYGIKIENSLGELSFLLNYLVSKIISTESKLTLPCLGSLANLCRNNAIVQDYIKNMSNVKMFFKSVASFLSHDNWMNIIFALSLLSISLDEPLGEKVFNKKNIDQTFQLIFNVLLKGGSCDTRKYSCDLLVDLLKCKRMQQYLASYADLQNHVIDLVFMLTSADEESCEKILELLISLDCVPDLLKTMFLKEDVGKKSINVEEHERNCWSIILKMAAADVSSKFRVASLALKLIKIIYQDNPSSLRSDTDIVPILSKNFHLIENNCPGNLKEKYGNIRRSIEILQILCCEEKKLEVVTGCLSSQTIHRFLTNIINKFSLDFTSEYQSHIDYSLEVSSVFIGLLELLFLIVKHSNIGENFYLKILQSPETSPFLACCLASQSINLVQRSMKIIQRATQISNFSVDALSVIIAKNNKHIEDKVNALQKQRLEDSSFPFSTALMMRNEPPKSRNKEMPYADKEDSNIIASLADRISSGLEIKDSTKISEIMDIYEHKLAAVQVKEKELQDLLDAKTTALSQSDRFISQYRCRSAQSEAECLKLRSLLLDSQKTSEEQQEQLKENIARLDELVEKIEILEKEKRSFLEVVEEFEQLQITHQDYKQRLEATQHSLDVAEKENMSLNEMNTVLRKQGDNLKSRHETLLQNFKELEKEKQSTQQLLIEKEKKHEESLKSISSLKQHIKTKETEMKEVEKKAVGIEKLLKQSEKAKADLSHKVSSLSVLNEKYEKEAKDNDIVIKDLKSQLEKHSQIAAMIHNLSSGKIPCNALNFSS